MRNPEAPNKCWLTQNVRDWAVLVDAFAWSGEGGEFTRLRTQQTKGGWTERTLGISMASRESAGNLSSMNG